ncbi:MAG TPA: hypothetical protein VI322_02635 [Candidatus Saccharimonadia bacterium]
MKTISAKEFQLRQSDIMKEVAAGMVYEVTFHGKPWVELRPTRAVRRLAPGSVAAFRASLAFTLPGSHLPAEPDYKRLRRDGVVGGRDV